MAETWKPITGYEGLYEVSNLGNVASLNYKGKGVRRVLKQSKNTHGYPQVVLKPRGEKCKCFMTHRLVAKGFIPNPNNLPFVNHEDETRDNNNVDNLEWCTRRYNNTYGTARERMRAKQINKQQSIPVVATSPNGEEEYYPSMAEAGFKFTGKRNGSQICYAIKRNGTSYGRRWRKADGIHQQGRTETSGKK